MGRTEIVLCAVAIYVAIAVAFFTAGALAGSSARPEPVELDCPTNYSMPLRGESLDDLLGAP
jgi:hypothetical protein